MHRYQIEVNGNLYTVTVKSISGDKAVVDVDGLEFEANIGDSIKGVPSTPVTLINTRRKTI